MQHVAVGTFTTADALGTLLTTESLLFAVFALAMNLSAPTERGRAWLVPGPVLVVIALVALAGMSAGGSAAWFELFVVGGFPSRVSEQMMALAIVTAIVIQPVLALLLALGLREREAV